MKRRNIKIGYGIIILWMVWPLIPMLLASLVAMACGCKLDEGDAHPCIVFGTDIGGGLYVMFVMGLMVMGTFPSGLIALVVFSLFVWCRKRTADPDQAGEAERGDPDAAKHDWVLWLGLGSLLCSFLTAIPALIIAFRSRPLVTRAKIGAAIAMLTLLGHVVVPIVIQIFAKS